MSDPKDEIDRLLMLDLEPGDTIVQRASGYECKFVGFVFQDTHLVAWVTNLHSVWPEPHWPEFYPFFPATYARHDHR